MKLLFFKKCPLWENNFSKKSIYEGAIWKISFFEEEISEMSFLGSNFENVISKKTNLKMYFENFSFYDLRE